MSLKKKLISGGIATILVRIIGTVIAFFLSVFLARTLGAEGFGIYSFVLSLLVFLSIPIQAGFPNLIVREVAKSLLKNDWLSIKGLVLWVLKLITVYTSLLGGLIGFFYFLDVNWLEKERLSIFLIGFILILLIPVLLLQNALIRGLGRVILGIFPDSVLRPGFTFLIAGIVFFVSKETLAPHTVILSYVLSVFIAVCLSMVFIWKLTPVENRKLTAINMEIDMWKKAAYPLTIVGGLQLMYGYVDIIILGFYHSNKDVGVYRAISQLGMLVVFGLSAINQMLHSYFVKFYLEKKIDQLQKLVTYSYFAIFGIATIPALIFVFCGEFVLNTIFGSEYIAGTVPLIILTIGQFANATFGSVGALLNMTGHEKDAMKGMLYSLGVNLILSFILIPLYGMVGAAIATAISSLVWNAILRHYVKKRLTIESIGFI